MHKISLIAFINAMIMSLFPLCAQNPAGNSFLYSCQEVENSENYMKGNLYQKDLLLFIDLLKQTHPAFALRSDMQPFDIDSINKVEYQNLSQCNSVSVLQNKLQAIASLLNDGHTTVLPELDKRMIYPLSLFNEKGKIYIKGISKTYADCIGKEVLLINGGKVEGIINSFRPNVSSDNEEYFRDKINNLMQFYSIWKNNPYCRADSLLHLTLVDSTTVTLRPGVITKNEIAWLQPRKQPVTARKQMKMPFAYTLFPEKSLCYLQFNLCMDQSSLRLQYSQNGKPLDDKLEQKISQYPRWDNFIEKMFEEIQKQDIRNLVVDVRDNGGGNSRLCDVLLSWLKPLNELKSGSSFIRFSDCWKHQYPVLAERYGQAFEQKGIPMEKDTLYSNSWLSGLLSSEKQQSAPSFGNGLFKMNQDDKRIFKGKVYFLQNLKTYSSAGLLIVKAKDNNIGVVVGDRSSYRPCSYGDLLSWELPNTKIKGVISHKVFNRPNIEECGNIYLNPDVYLPSTWQDLVEGEDAVWTWILKVISPPMHNTDNP